MKNIIVNFCKKIIKYYGEDVQLNENVSTIDNIPSKENNNTNKFKITSKIIIGFIVLYFTFTNCYLPYHICQNDIIKNANTYNLLLLFLFMNFNLVIFSILILKLFKYKYKKKSIDF